MELVTHQVAVDFENSDRGARVTFEDGHVEEAGLVIAADGLHSVARRLLVDDQPVNSAYVAYRGAMPIEQVRVLAEQIEAAGGHAEVAVDLEAQTVTAPDGTTFGFRTPAALRLMLLEGLDEIGLTLTRSDEIARYRTRDRERRPWVYQPGIA